MLEQSAVQRAQESNTPKIVKFDALADRIDDMFNAIARRAYEIFEGNGHQLGHDIEDWFKAESELLRRVNVEITETDDTLEVKAEVPGFSEKELEISVEPRRLTVTGKHEASKEEKKGKTVYSETSASNILRVIGLPAEVETAKASATLKNGVLKVTAPKAAKAQSARIRPKAA
jgi:HSP20 family protein